MHGKSAASARFSYSTQSCDSFSYEYQIMVLLHVHHHYLHRCHGHHPKLESVIYTEMHKQHMLKSDNLQYNTVGRWVDGTIVPPSYGLMFILIDWQ